MDGICSYSTFFVLIVLVWKGKSLNDFLKTIALSLNITNPEEINTEIKSWKDKLGKYCNSITFLHELVNGSQWVVINLDPMIKTKIEIYLNKQSGQLNQQIAYERPSPAYCYSPSISSTPTNFLERSLWKPSRKLHSYRIEATISNQWRLIEHPSFQSLQKTINSSSLLCIQGRRRIGKTQMLHTFCDQLVSSSQHFIFLTAIQDERDWIESVNESLALFDETIGLISSKKQSIECLYWLVMSGVWVIIDEFQELNYIDAISVLKLCIDVKQNFNGKLIVAGSHLTEIDKIFSSNGYLYIRGFKRFVVDPFSTSCIFDYLLLNGVTQQRALTLVSLFGGIIGIYSELSRNGQLFQSKREELFTLVQSFICSDEFYNQFLFDSSVFSALEYFSSNESEGITVSEQKNHFMTIEPSLGSTGVDILIQNLKKYDFIREVMFIFENHSRLVVIDHLSRAYMNLRDNETFEKKMSCLERNSWKEICERNFQNFLENSLEY